jgi:hypothetical protein
MIVEDCGYERRIKVMKTSLRLFIAFCSLFVSADQFKLLISSEQAELFVQLIFHPVDLLVIAFSFLVGTLLCAATWKKVVHSYKSMIKDKKNKFLFMLLEFLFLCCIYLYTILVELWIGVLACILSILYGISTGITTSYSYNKQLQRSKDN